MVKRLYVLKDNTIIKINNMSAEMGIGKSELVELAVDNYENDISVKIAKLQAHKDLIDGELTILTDLKTREESLISSLEDQKTEYKANIKRKMDEGDVVSAVEIAKRVGRLLKCSYLQLLPE